MMWFLSSSTVSLMQQDSGTVSFFLSQSSSCDLSLKQEVTARRELHCIMGSGTMARCSPHDAEVTSKLF